MLSKDSKITRIEVKDYASYKHEVFNIDPNKPIVKFEGYNNSGKSALLRGIAMVTADRYADKQGKFVRDGQPYWVFGMEFSDGAYIEKTKYRSGGVRYVFKDGDEVIYDSKEGNATTRVRNTPPSIKRYMNFLESTAQILNFRDRDDDLLLVDTKGSDNYKSLNEVLRNEGIVEASERLNKDINQANNDFNRADASYNSAKMSADEYAGYTAEAERVARFASEEYSRMLDKANHVNRMEAGINEVKVTQEAAKTYNLVSYTVKRVQEGLKKGEGISSVQLALQKYAVVADKSEVDYRFGGVPERLSMGIAKARVLTELEQKLREVEEADKAAGVDVKALENLRGSYQKNVEKAEKLAYLQGSINSYVDANNFEKDAIKVYNSLKKKLDNQTAELAERGYKVITCPNCKQSIAVEE